MRWVVWEMLAASLAAAASAGQQAEVELKRLSDKVPAFKVIDLPVRAGKLTLSLEQSLTADMLRSVELDEDPPLLGQPAEPYPANMIDGFPPGQAPYVARDIKPFRFRYFNCEFNYGGWHNWAMVDYASAHGFNILSAYRRAPSDCAHVPKGTKWLRWGGFVNWEEWLRKHEIPELRYDLLAERDLTADLVQSGVFKGDAEYQFLMIDLEHPRLSLDELRKQEWYPTSDDQATRAAFEKRYYEGYAKTYAAPVQAARQEGWANISLYGWQPFQRTWFGLDKAVVDPKTDWAWNTFGKTIYETVDILNPSVYCFYWSPQNVAYTLANIDLNMKLVNSMPQRKPLRPYYWTLLHGGGGGWRWWKGQPMRNEDARAMFALCFFTGCDGFDLWNWSGTGNHHVPGPIQPDADLMVGQRFEVVAVGAPPGSAAQVFERYDVIHVNMVSEDGLATFQRIEKGDSRGNYGVSDDKPVYAMPKDKLLGFLRPSSEPVAAVIEGLALVKPFEYLLRHGEVKVDVTAQEQFAKTLPIVRRVKLERYHVIATYDPEWAEVGKPRQIVLPNFDGHQGLSLLLPADAQTRIFVFSER